jgi:hypothetical protein
LVPNIHVLKEGLLVIVETPLRIFELNIDETKLTKEEIYNIENYITVTEELLEKYMAREKEQAG